MDNQKVKDDKRTKMLMFKERSGDNQKVKMSRTREEKYHWV